MALHAFRLYPKQDLRNGIREYCDKNNIKAAALVTVVGSLREMRIRLADGKTVIEETHDYEIVSMTGTVAENGLHFHISLSDSRAKVIGGHVKEGCIINTTAEIVLIEIESFRFRRTQDETTGYEELEVTKK